MSAFMTAGGLEHYAAVSLEDPAIRTYAAYVVKWWRWIVWVPSGTVRGRDVLLRAVQAVGREYMCLLDDNITRMCSWAYKWPARRPVHLLLTAGQVRRFFLQVPQDLESQGALVATTHVAEKPYSDIVLSAGICGKGCQQLHPRCLHRVLQASVNGEAVVEDGRATSRIGCEKNNSIPTILDP